MLVPKKLILMKLATINSALNHARRVRCFKKQARSYVPGLDDGQFKGKMTPSDKAALKNFLTAVQADSEAAHKLRATKNTFPIVANNTLKGGYGVMSAYLSPAGLDILEDSYPDRKLTEKGHQAYIDLIKHYNNNIYPKTEDYKQEAYWDHFGLGFGSSKRYKGKSIPAYPTYQDYLDFKAKNN